MESASPVSQAPTHAVETPRNQRLQQAAEQFEAMMLNELMKPLARSGSEDEDKDGDSAGPLQSFGLQAVSGALARSGALGFAGRIIHSIEAKTALEAPGNVSQKTV